MPLPGYTDPYADEASEIERRRRYADMLREQSGNPIQPFSQGGVVAPISWTQGAAKLLQGYNAGAAGRDAEQRAKALRERVQGDRTSDMSALAGALRGSPGGMQADAADNVTQMPGRPAGQLDPAIMGQLKSPDMQNMAMKIFAEQMVPKRPEPFTLSAGAVRYDAQGKPIASAPSKPQNQSDLARLIAERDGLPQGDPRRAVYDNAIRKASETTKQISPTVINNPAPTLATIVRDGRTIVVDARTGKEVGESPKLSDAAKFEQKRKFNMAGIGQIIQSAEDVLGGVNRDASGIVSPGAKPTGSGVGTLVDAAAGFVGMSPSGSAEAQKLKAISGALVAKMPRMEGPQSDKDVMLYKEMAGLIGDSTVPIARRSAALDTVKQLWAKYENLNPEGFEERRGGAGDEPPPGAVRPRK